MSKYGIRAKANPMLVRGFGTPVYHGTFLKPAYLEFREIASPQRINWQIGDYVDYDRTGFRYKLYSVPQPVKQAVSAASGESFVYRDVQFFAATKDLEIAPFRDLVISDNTIHFTTLPDVSTYEDVFGIARRIQANMDSFFGEGLWNIKVTDVSDSDVRAVLLETKSFSLSNGSCLDALTQIYSQWRGIGWVYSVENGVNTITIGRPNVQDGTNTTSVFAYGIGNGLTLIKKEQSGKNDLATRLYAYGSTRNLIARYYNNITPAIKDAQSVYIPNLMIPPSYWGMTDGQRDARKAYLEAEYSTVARYGVRPKVIYFDGNGDYDEIYPSLEGLTAGDVRAAMSPTDDYYPSVTFAPDSQRVDEVYDAVNPSDNGVIGESTGSKYSETVSMQTSHPGGTYHLAPTQQSVKIPLDPLSGNRNVTASGKATVTPKIAGTIVSSANLGALSVRVWLEIGGVKYGEQGCKITRNGNTYSFVLDEPYTVTTESVGRAEFKGFIFAAPTNPSVASTLTYSFDTNGMNEVSIESVVDATFSVVINQIGFDISKQASAISDGLCTVAFKSGWCAGREFTVKKCVYRTSDDKWVLTLARQSDESIGQYFPNSVYRIAHGDRFVILDLVMPEIYITTAQQRLYDRASEALASMSAPKMVYEPEIDAKVLAQSPETILEGMYMPIRDEDLIGDTVTINGQTVHQEWVLIDSLEINEGEAEIPTYKITLQDEKRESFLSKLTKESGRNAHSITEITIKDLRSEVEELTPSVVEPEPVSVRVVASHPVIGYEYAFDEPPVNEVVLTCETTGIDNPTFQWYYLGNVTWVAISGATSQTYTVDPDSSLYFLDGEVVEDFRCVVSGNGDLSDQVQVMKVLSHAVTMSLSHPAHLFEAGEEYAVAATDDTDILGYRGTERIATNVRVSDIRFLNAAGTPITPSYGTSNLLDSSGNKLTDSAGKYLVTAAGGTVSIYDTNNNLMLSVEIVNNNTASAHMVVTVTDKLNIPVGKIEIPIVIQEADAVAGTPARVMKLYYSWALALKGDAPLFADITNETEGVAVGSDQRLDANVTLSTGVILYYGMQAEELSSVVPVVPSAYTGKITATATIAADTLSASVSVVLTAPIDFTNVDYVDIPIALTSARGERTVVFTIIPVAEGEDGATFHLVPSHDVVKGTYDSNNTVQYDPASVTCERMMRSGSGSLQPSNFGVLKVSVNNGSTRTVYDPSNPPTAASAVTAGRIIFYWYTDNAETSLIDRETIPLVTDGASPLVADLTNEMDGLGVGADGILDVAATTKTTLQMWAGLTPLTPASITVTGLPTGVTYTLGHTTSSQTSPLTGEITFSIAVGTNLSAGRYAISITGTHALGSRTLIYTLMGVKEGKDGTTFILVLSCTSVKQDANGDYSEDFVTCTAIDNTGEAITATHYIYFQREGVDTNPISYDNYILSNPDGIPTDSIETILTFYLYLVSPVVDPSSPTYDDYVDIETVPLIKDGEAGVGVRGKSMRGISTWSEYGYGGTSSSQSYYMGSEDATGEYYDIVINPTDGLFYQCKYRVNPESGKLATDDEPSSNLVEDATPGCWELMNNFENIATKALAVDKAVINDLVAGIISVDQLETSNKQIKIAGSQITVKDGNGIIRSLIHSGNLTSSRSGSSAAVGASVSATSAAGADHVDVNILGGSATITVEAANNIITIPALTLSASLSASGSAPFFREWAVTFLAVNAAQEVVIRARTTYPILSGQSIASFTTTIPEGTWTIICRVSPSDIASDQTITATTSYASAQASSISITYPVSGASTESAGNGWQTIWGGHGFKATSAGAKIIRSNTELDAVGGDGVKKIKIVVPPDDYPSEAQMEADTLYIKLTTSV